MAYELGQFRWTRHLLTTVIFIGYLSNGQPLGARLLEGAQPADEFQRYGLQLAEALGHAHERGGIHPDMKFANVMIAAEGRAEVLDFGMAKRSPARNSTMPRARRFH